MGFPTRLRFGVFEVDLQSGELKKQGVKLKLQDQPFQILAALLERQGEIITREDLRQRLGASNTFGDFDHLVNKAVNKIRDVLGDSADSPLFVETLPRRGYRFLVPVQSIDPLVPRPSRRRIAEISSIAAGVLLISAVGLLWWSRPSAVSPHRRAIKQLTRDAGVTTDPALSSDGKFLAYASDRGGDGNLDIWVQQLAGGEPARLTRDPADEREPSFAPDGTQIAFRSSRDGGGIYVISTLGGEPRLIAKLGHGPRFSPQGDSIVYWLGQPVEGDPAGSGSAELRLAPSAGGPSRPLRSDFASAGHPVWSPDGKHILFRGAQYRPGDKQGDAFDWWITTPDGSTLVRTGIKKAFSTVQDSNFYNINPSDWEGDRILFSAQVGDSTNLWQVHLSRTGEIRGVPERVTLGAGFETAPSLDKFGHVVFSSLSQKSTIWSLPMDSSAGRVLGPAKKLTTEGGPDLGASISVDGKRLAYTTIRTGRTQIITKDLEHGDEQVLTEGGNGRSLISRDGLRLAYAVSNGEQIGLYVTNTKGGGTEKLCDDCARYWDWSSDGKKVVYISGDHPPWPAKLHDVQSGRATEILHHTQYSVYEPRFSPDVRWISFSARVGPDRTQAFVINVQGGASIGESDWIPIGAGPFSNGTPEWAPSGQLLYIPSHRDGFGCIWAQRIDGITKRAVGEPFGVYHCHRANLVLDDLSSPALDKMILTLQENTANIWMTELE